MKSLITQSPNATRLAILDPKTVSKRWQEELGIDVGERFRALPELALWQCHDTGLRWYEPPEAAGDGALYRQLESLPWYYQPEKWEFLTSARRLRKGERVLEVGVGFGFFLELCRGRGIDISGIELNPSAAMEARKKGFEIFEESLDVLADRVGGAPFDTVCAFQVLEHVPRPREFIGGLLQNLKVGGRLLLSVPNAAVLRRCDPGHEDLLNQAPHHMGHWEGETFRALEGVFPVKVRSIDREPLAAYHVAWLVTGYLRGLLSPFGKTLSRLLVNRYSIVPVQALLAMGLRKRLPGHTLLVELEKVSA